MSLTTHTNFSHIILNNFENDQSRTNLKDTNLITKPNDLHHNYSYNDLDYNKNINNLHMSKNLTKNQNNINICKLKNDLSEKELNTNQRFDNEENNNIIYNNVNNQKRYIPAGIQNLVNQQEDTNMSENNDCVNSNSENFDISKSALNPNSNICQNQEFFTMKNNSSDSDFFFDINEASYFYSNKVMKTNQINTAVDRIMNSSINKINGILIFGSAKNGMSSPYVNSQHYKNLLMQARNHKEKILKKENFTE